MLASVLGKRQGASLLKRTQKRLYAVIAMVVTAVMLFPAAATGQPISPAQENLPEYLTIRKSVSKEELVPGDEFVYDIFLSCQETDCINAELNDNFPAELEGWPITNVVITPGAAEIPRTATWYEGGTALVERPAVLGADTRLHVDVSHETSNDTIGMVNGQTLRVQVTVRVPADLPGGTDITAVNHVTSHADNSAPGADDATVRVQVPGTINADITKSWNPVSQPFNAGTESQVSLQAVNTSNIPVERLIVQDPATAVDGESVLDATNPFGIVDLGSLDSATFPDGADTVQVDAYVKQTDGTYAWVTGTAAATAALPAGVDAADVAGLRFTFEGEILAGASTTIGMTVAQRGTDRDTGDDLSVAQQNVTNRASATAVQEGYDPVTVNADAPYTITPANVAANATKNIVEDRIGAGEDANATLTGRNASEVPVAELVISDRDFFTTEVTFDGFSRAPVWPTGAPMP